MIFRISDAQVRLLRDDVAVLVYNVHEELTVDGQPVTMDAASSSRLKRSLPLVAYYGDS
jgi:hypothetical protein